MLLFLVMEVRSFLKYEYFLFSLTFHIQKMPDIGKMLNKMKNDRKNIFPLDIAR